MARTLSGSYVWKGEIYIPNDDGTIVNTAGQEVELPGDFPSDADLEANQKRSLGAGGGSAVAPLTKNVNAASEDLEGMTKDELSSLADERGVEVKRGDGESGTPVKADYVKALTKAAKAK